MASLGRGYSIEISYELNSLWFGLTIPLDRLDIIPSPIQTPYSIMVLIV